MSCKSKSVAFKSAHVPLPFEKQNTREFVKQIIFYMHVDQAKKKGGGAREYFAK